MLRVRVSLRRVILIIVLLIRPTPLTQVDKVTYTTDG
jgi:hypothetical protein